MPHQSNRVSLTCAGCNTTFTVPASRLVYGSPRWCSTKCRYSTPGWEKALFPDSRVTLTCAGCGEQFEVIKSKTRQYCTVACAARVNSAAKNRRIDYTCETCGTTFKGKRSLAQRKRYCSTRCRAIGSCRVQRTLRPTRLETCLRDAISALGIVTTSEHRVGRYVVDLAIPERCIAIEADGAYWHGLPGAQERDARKDAALIARGWTVLRFSEDRITNDAAGCALDVRAALDR